jgi:hypothetical protein
MEKEQKVEELTVSGKDLQDKLLRLSEYMPSETPKLYAAATYLASRLGDGDLNPRGFASAFELLFQDMMFGIDGYTNEPIPKNLRDPLGIAYSMASRKVPIIAEAICSKDFANEVQNILKEA